MTGWLEQVRGTQVRSRTEVCVIGDALVMMTSGTPRGDAPPVIQGSGWGQGVLREQGPCPRLFGVSEARKPGPWVT